MDVHHGRGLHADGLGGDGVEEAVLGPAGQADRAINPCGRRFGAQRAGAVIVEVPDVCHAAALPEPKPVAGPFWDAVRATSRLGRLCSSSCAHEVKIVCLGRLAVIRRTPNFELWRKGLA
ncbi:hypothetical protein [Streptomyces enissocaesilis]|uniref:Uncharacterized protein n=1 Tax=Streptomyces enissocaesilis TaxID=332589 RepID=A0ABN3WXJ7_9ACTN